MKILFLARSLERGGAERQLVALARGLRQAGHTITVSLFYGGGPLEAELREAGVAVRSLDKSGRWDLVSFLARLVRLVRSERPDIIHSYLVEPNILTVLLKTVSPDAKVVWGVRASGRDLRRYERFIRLAFRLECFLSRYAALIIANSRAGRADHVACGFPDEKTVVVPNGIDTELFRPDRDARRRVRAELGIGENEKVIGVVARLDPMKDHPTFLRAAALLASEKTDLRFLCAGNGPSEYRRELLFLADGLGLSDRVIWSPVRPDVAAVYNSLDVLVSSSCWGEGFSNVIGEAMACGIPCVVTDAGDSAMIVGDTGIVVPPGNPESLASGIRGLLDEEPAQQAERAAMVRARVTSEFSVERLVQRTEKLLFERLSRTGRYPA